MRSWLSKAIYIFISFKFHDIFMRQNNVPRVSLDQQFLVVNTAMNWLNTCLKQNIFDEKKTTESKTKKNTHWASIVPKNL